MTMQRQPIDAFAGYWLDGALRTLDGLQRGFNSTVSDPPAVTPYRVVFETGKLRLRRYAAMGVAHRTPVLVVYALVKRPFVLDMQPGRSVVEFLTQAGFDVYLTDWMPPNPTDTWRGFDAYVNGDLAKAVRAIRAMERVDRVTVLGYCLGSLLSLVYTALYPQNVRNLITATTPFDMSVRDLPIYKLVERMTSATVDMVMRVYGNCPAWLMQTFFTAMAPVHHAVGKYVGLHRNAERDGFAESFDLFERWMNSDVPLAGRIFKELTNEIFRDNQLVRGGFKVAGRTVNLKHITCPFLNVVAEYDDVVHPRSSLSLVDSVGSLDRENLTFPTGHVGAMVSGAAIKKLWPQIGTWLDGRSN